MPGRLADRGRAGEGEGLWPPGQIQTRDHPEVGTFGLEIGREARLEGRQLGVLACVSETPRRVREGSSGHGP